MSSHVGSVASPEATNGASAFDTPHVAAVLAAMADGLVALNNEGRILHLNPRAELILQQKRSEIAGRLLWDVFPELQWTPLIGAVRTVLATGEGREMSLLLPQPLHCLVDLQIRALPYGVLLILKDVTSQRPAEAELRFQSDSLRLVLDAASLGDWTWDLASDVVTLSERAAAIFEIPPGPHMTWTEMRGLLHPADIERTTAAIALSLNHRSPYRVEYRVKSASEGWRWVSAMGAAALDPAGHVTSMIGVLQDISDRKRTEVEREIAAERLKRAHHAARAAAWEWNLATGAITWSDPAEVQLLTGWPAPPANPLSLEEWAKIIHPEDREQHRLGVIQAVSQGQGRIEFRILSPDGSVRWLETSGHVVETDAEGRPRTMRGITLDITDRRDAEQRLQQREQQFKTLADRVPSFVWFSDVDGQIQYLNRRWHEFTGRPEQAGLGIGWLTSVHPDDRPHTVKIWEDAAAERKPYEAEMRHQRHDGAYRWYVARAEPLFDSQGVITGWFGTATDIHERRLAEEEARAESEALEILNRTGATIASEINLESVVQTVTDAGVELTGAQFGAFFYNVQNEGGESYTLYTISGVDREHFAKFPMPRNTHVFEPTFRGLGVVRSDDITKDPRYGRNDPHWGMPKGHLPVCSYLAVPVISRSGEVLGGLFFGHQDAGVFNARSERLMTGIAAQAAIAIDNARLFRSAQHQIAARERNEAALQDSEQFIRSVVEASSDCIAALDQEGRLQFMNQSGRRLMELEEVTLFEGEAWSSLWPEQVTSTVADALKLASEGGIGRFSASRTSSKGTTKWWDVIVTPVLSADGTPVRLVSIARDVTEHHKAEEARQLLLRELNHRVKNLFAIVSGMVTMTARSASTVDQMATTIKGRLSALAKAHELIRSAITKDRDHHGVASLDALAREVLSPHLDPARPDQVQVQGPPFTLGVSAATSLALILHELATNAVKYGALGQPDGQIRIAWTLEQGTWRLWWQEHAPGKTLVPPTQEGFGSRLARSSATGQLGGTISYDWQPTGLRIALTAPVPQLQR